MNAITIADKLVWGSRIFIFAALIALPLNVQAEYYLVYGAPAVPVVCDYCHAPRHYYRPVHHRHVCQVKKTHKKYYRTTYRRHSHYRIDVYYPVAVYAQQPCGSCGGFLEPTYYWASAPYRVYYTHPDDRLVGNRYGESYEGPSLDTGTADNDIY